MITYYEVQINGEAEPYSSLNRYLFIQNDTHYLFWLANCYSQAEEYSKIAEYLNIENDGIFQTLLYRQNTITYFKEYLSKFNYKISNLKKDKLVALITERFNVLGE